MFNFGKKEIITGTSDTLSEENKNLREKIQRMETDHTLAIRELESDHKLALKDKEFELKHFKDETIKALEAKIVGLEKEKAVLETKNQMLKEVNDLDADIIDVKDVVNKLIEKLPEIKLSSLTVNSNPQTKN